MIKTIPQGFTKVWIKAYDSAAFFSYFYSLEGCLFAALAGHRQTSVVEDPAISHKVEIELIYCEHHISSGISVKREISVSILVGMNEGKCCINIVINNKAGIVNANAPYSFCKLFSKYVFSHLANICCRFRKA